jgi:phosphohistidine phosphatase
MDLILWRHADAEDGSPDMTRVLTPKGQRQAERVAHWLAPHLPAAARILASPATRAQQTAQALGRRVETLHAIAPGAGVDEVLAAIDWPRGDGCALLVGHQPTLGQLALYLIGGQRGDLAFGKACAWWFQRRARDGESQAVLKAVVSPDWL